MAPGGQTGKLVLPLDDELAFAAVVVNGAETEGRRLCASLEVEIQGAVVRVHADTDLRLMAAVVRTLKAAG